MGEALSVGGEDVRPSRDVRSLLIPESREFISIEPDLPCMWVSESAHQESPRAGMGLPAMRGAP